MCKNLFKRFVGAVISSILIFNCIVLHYTNVSASQQTVKAKVVANQSNTVVLKPDGTVWVCGSGRSGQLGNNTSGENIYSDRFIKVQNLSGVIDVSLGQDFILALKSDGTVWGWGSQTKGQLGNGFNPSNQKTPCKIDNLENITSISSGGQNSAAINQTGDLYTWGSNSYGCLADGTETRRGTPQKICENVKKCCMGHSNLAVIKDDGTLWTCGYNAEGRNGNGSTDYAKNVFTLQKIDNLPKMKDIAVGWCTMIAVDEDGYLWGWGMNYYGEIGVGNQSTYSSPVKNTKLSNIEKVALTYTHSLILTKDGNLYGCGMNSDNQLLLNSDPGYVIVRNITKIDALDNIADISAGYYHSVAITKQGKILSWGENEYGQCGNGNSEKLCVPTEAIDDDSSVFSTNSNKTTTYDNIYDYDPIINIIGPQEIKYDIDSHKYDMDNFKLYITPKIQKNLKNYNENTLSYSKLNIKITIPDGFSFSNSDIIKTKEINARLNKVLPIDIFLNLPTVGDHIFSAVIIDESGNIYSRNQKNHTLSIVETGFQEDIYRAHYNAEKSTAVGAIYNKVMVQDSPARRLKNAAAKNGLNLTSISWDMVNKSLNTIDNPGKILDYAFEEKDIYKAMIFEMFDCKTENKLNDFISDKNIKNFNTFRGLVIKDLENIYTYDQLKHIHFSPAQSKNIMKIIKERFGEEFYELDDANTGLDYIFDTLDYTGNFFEITEQVFNNYQLYKLNNSAKQLLTDMYNKAPDDNLALKTALTETKAIIDASEAEFMAQTSACAVQMAGKDAVRYGIKNIWKIAKNKAYAARPELLLAHSMIKTSQFASEILFNTSKTSEAYHRLGTVDKLGTTLFAAYNESRDRFISNPTVDNAKNYNASIQFLGAYYELNCDTVKNFPEKIDDSSLGQIFGVNGTEDLKNYLESEKNDVKKLINNANVEWIEALANDYPTFYSYYDKNRDKFKVYEIHCPVDVYVFDKNGVLVASIEGETLYYDGEANITIARNGDDKIVYTYNDEYTIIYKATDDGTMNIAVNEYTDSQNKETVNFNNVTLIKDIEYTAEENSQYGKDAAYCLEQPTARTLPDYNSSKESEKYTLRIESGIIVSNSMQDSDFSEGQKIDITTYIPDECTFIGWESNAGNIFDNDSSVITTITMPDRDVNIKANILVPDYIKGDVNRNGNVEKDDAYLLFKGLFENTSLKYIQKLAANINDDDSINLLDIINILETVEKK